MPFRIPEPKRFSTTKLDIFVFTVVVIVFMWSFWIDSFHPIKNETGEKITFITDKGIQTLPKINYQVFLAPLIMVYEMFVLIVLDGKLKGRELPFKLYALNVKIMLQNRLNEAMDEYYEWKQSFKKK